MPGTPSKGQESQLPTSGGGWPQLDMFQPGQRLKYCTEKHGEPLGPTEPILTEEMLSKAMTPMSASGEILVLSKLEHFEAEQPALKQMLDLATDGWTTTASIILTGMFLCIHETFKVYFPAPAILPNDLREIAKSLCQPFRQAKVCVCYRYQAPLMKCVIAAVERRIESDKLTAIEGNRIALLSVIAIEALDQSATVAMLNGLSPDNDECDEEDGRIP